MKFQFIHIFALFAVAFSANWIAEDAELSMKKLLKGASNGRRFTLQKFRSLVEQGAQVADHHLSFAKSCTDPEGFFDYLYENRIGPDVSELISKFFDLEAFEMSYQNATDRVKKEFILELFVAKDGLDVYTAEFTDFDSRAIKYAGALGLVIPNNIDHWFLDLSKVFRRDEMITLDFLKFYVNNGIDFNSPTFTDIHLIENLICSGEYELAGFMADHGARLSVTKDEITGPDTSLRKFIAGRAWTKANLRLFLAGLFNPGSILSVLPKEVPLDNICGLLYKVFESEIYKIDGSQ